MTDCRVPAVGQSTIRAVANHFGGAFLKRAKESLGLVVSPVIEDDEQPIRRTDLQQIGVDIILKVFNPIAANDKRNPRGLLRADARRQRRRLDCPEIRLVRPTRPVISRMFKPLDWHLTQCKCG
jgi:hypothetical protein